MVRRHRVGVRYPYQMPLKPPTPNQETPSSTHSTLGSFFRKNCLQSQPTEILKKIHVLTPLIFVSIIGTQKKQMVAPGQCLVCHDPQLILDE